MEMGFDKTLDISEYPGYVEVASEKEYWQYVTGMSEPGVVDPDKTWHDVYNPVDHVYQAVYSDNGDIVNATVYLDDALGFYKESMGTGLEGGHWEELTNKCFIQTAGQYGADSAKPLPSDYNWAPKAIECKDLPKFKAWIDSRLEGLQPGEYTLTFGELDVNFYSYDGGIKLSPDQVAEALENALGIESQVVKEAVGIGR
jgi:hypothetical protein